jgi:hypothetical protein
MTSAPPSFVGDAGAVGVPALRDAGPLQPAAEPAPGLLPQRSQVGFLTARKRLAVSRMMPSLILAINLPSMLCHFMPYTCYSLVALATSAEARPCTNPGKAGRHIVSTNKHMSQLMHLEKRGIIDSIMECHRASQPTFVQCPSLTKSLARPKGAPTLIFSFLTRTETATLCPLRSPVASPPST